MSADPVHNAYIATLKEKYRSALADEKAALEQLEGARRRKEIYASTLREERIDLRAILGPIEGTYTISGKPYLFQHLHAGENGSAANNGETGILSDTHAVYLAIRKHLNTGFSFEEIAKLSTDNGYPLTAEEAKKVFWKQQNEKRMTRRDGKVFLTKEGEAFNKFRVQKHAS